MTWIDNSRIMAISAVVILHVAETILAPLPVGTERWWIANFYDSFVRWSVPVYVMISGAQLLDSAKSTN